MTRRCSAGLLLYRDAAGQAGAIEVLVGHMGGPLWARRDAGAWTIPKGEYTPDEQPLAAARREFAEELGIGPPDGPVIDLGSVRQSAGKTVTAFAMRGDVDTAAIVPGTFTLIWPPRSGVLQEFPELDRVAWMSPARAAKLIVAAQRSFLDRLSGILTSAAEQ